MQLKKSYFKKCLIKISIMVFWASAIEACEPPGCAEENWRPREITREELLGQVKNLVDYFGNVTKTAKYSFKIQDDNDQWQFQIYPRTIKTQEVATWCGLGPKKRVNLYVKEPKVIFCNWTPGNMGDYYFEGQEAQSIIDVAQTRLKNAKKVKEE